jgi:hypothetical protein
MTMNNQPERTMKPEGQQRKEFEEWALDKVTSLLIDKIDSEYFWVETHLAWEAWQAAQKGLTEQRDRLAEALRECREDSGELLGERDWWQNESRLDYQKRYQETCNNVTRADEALQSLTTNEL